MNQWAPQSLGNNNDESDIGRNSNQGDIGGMGMNACGPGRADHTMNMSGVDLFTQMNRNANEQQNNVHVDGINDYTVSSRSSTPPTNLTNGGGFSSPSTSGAMVFQVKTGESMNYVLEGMRQEHRPIETHPHNIDDAGPGREHSNLRDTSMPRSNSEPMLQTALMLGDMVGNANDLDRFGSSLPRPASTDVLPYDIINQVLGEEVSGQERHFGMNIDGGSGSDRRHSEPTLDLLSELLDEPTAAGGGNLDIARGGGNHMNLDGGGLEVNQASARSFDDLFPHVPGMMEGESSVAHPRRERSVSEPLDILSQLDNLDPDNGFDHNLMGVTKRHQQINGHSSSVEEMLRDNEMLRDIEKLNDPDYGSNRFRTDPCSKVKRSRSVDPLVMFRRTDDMNNPPQVNEANQQGEGLSREQPKRRRSAPLLSHDILDDMFGDSDENTLGNAANNRHGTVEFPTQSADAKANDNAPQKNTIDLIQMLLGIGDDTKSGGDGGEIDQQTPRPDSSLVPPALMPQPQLSPNDAPECPNDTLQTIQQQQTTQGISLGNVSGMIDASNPSGIFQVEQQRLHQMHATSSGISPMIEQQFNELVASATQLQQQAPLNINGFMSNNNLNPMQMMHAQPNNSADIAPPPLSIDNSEDLNLVLSAVKETQSNLRTLQPMVIQLGDPEAMEGIANAFKIAASSSQFVLASDLPSAYAALNEAWTKIKKVEDLLAQGHNHGLNSTFQGTGTMGRTIPPAQIQTATAGMKSGVSRGTNNPMMELPTGNQPPKPTPSSSEARSGSGQTSPSRARGKTKSRNRKSKSNPPTPEDAVVILGELPPQNKDDPSVIMARLKGLMERTQRSQKQLQNWDKKRGLPKSHSQTMVSSSRSRQQLQQGIVLKKWNGDALIPSSEAKPGSGKSDDLIPLSPDSKGTSPDQEQHKRLDSALDTVGESGEKPSNADASNGKIPASETVPFAAVAKR